MKNGKRKEEKVANTTHTHEHVYFDWEATTFSVNIENLLAFLETQILVEPSEISGLTYFLIRLGNNNSVGDLTYRRDRQRLTANYERDWKSYPPSPSLREGLGGVG